MITLNAVDRGTDEATLDYIVKSANPNVLDRVLKSYGFEVQLLDEEPEQTGYEPITKSQLFDLIKATKHVASTTTNAKGKQKQKVYKRILCHTKTGKEYYQMRLVNADVSVDAKLSQNAMKAFDEHVAMTRYAKTSHITEHAASVQDMMSTPEGQATLKKLNDAIGTGSPHGMLTTNQNITNIRYCLDTTEGVFDDERYPELKGQPKMHGLIAIAKSAKTGKDIYFYSKQYRELAEEERIQRAMTLASPAINGAIDKYLDEGGFVNQDVRDCLKLIHQYGMKSGNEMYEKKNQLGDYITSGATSLTAGNIYIEKKRVKDPQTGKMKTVEKVYLQYYQQGEKGDKKTQQSIEINDEILARRLKAKKKAATSDDERIFSCDRDEMAATCKDLFGCNPEDLRAAYGVRKATEAQRVILGTNPFEPKTMQRINKKTGKKEKLTPKRVEMMIAEVLKDVMGVKDKRSVERYINKGVIRLFFTKPAEKKKKDKPKKKTKK